jgi:hypothetical protein
VNVSSVKIFKKKRSWECFFCQDLQEEKLLGIVSVSSLILSLFCRGV